MLRKMRQLKLSMVLSGWVVALGLIKPSLVKITDEVEAILVVTRLLRLQHYRLANTYNLLVRGIQFFASVRERRQPKLLSIY
jgi:hypothetical protein